MSTQIKTENKSVQPADLENKALTPTVENKAAASDDGKVTFQLAHHFTYDGKDRLPGDTVKVTADEARSLERGGYGKIATKQS